ncbi:Chromatin assembly factor 1 subunit [Coemansia brasiliensis]|uniref:Chromatin assembly factor 1 subunit n=1 Tax=Coemansia brasiliensis TaxID=2650707 RepID=A0A9W8IHG1_9FUNG|nr:Chromatin assembly factor 1 subunit [Coemansia brasiliensis]
MRVKTVQINWHDKLPIFSVDFDHSWQGGGWRFATGGGDNNVRIWRLRSPRDPLHETQPVEFLASLNRHAAPVNVVRFSPASGRLASAGDDGVIIVWRQVENPPEALTDHLEDSVDTETWRPMAMLRGSLADICDLAWSPDGAFLVSASVDNTARVWDARDARCVQVLADHSHYVQGVAWDPLNEFIASQSSDRSLRVYRWLGSRAKGVRAGEQVARLEASHYSLPSRDDRAHRHRLFHDDNLTSFFRRPSVSPDGRLLATAAGVQRQPADARNTCFIWARDRLWTEPVLRLAGHAKPIVATRWAPCMFAADGPGWISDPPHQRMMLAVASQSAVSLYDTSVSGRAVGLMDGLHYAAITDLAWTADGSHLVIVSIDGFASVASLDQPTQALPLALPLPLPLHEPVPEAQLVSHSAANPLPDKSQSRKRVAPTLISTL